MHNKQTNKVLILNWRFNEDITAAEQTQMWCARFVIKHTSYSLLNVSLNNAWGRKVVAKYGTDHADNLSLILDKVYM